MAISFILYLFIYFFFYLTALFSCITIIGILLTELICEHVNEVGFVGLQGFVKSTHACAQ